MDFKQNKISKGEITMIAIKPCKDCGCPKILPYMKEGDGWWDMSYAMCCDRCGRQTRFYKTIEEAKESWNKEN